MHHLRQQKQLFVAPHRLLCYKYTPTLSSTLVSTHCSFSFHTISFFMRLFAQSLNRWLNFFFKKKLSYSFIFQKLPFLLQAYLIKTSLRSLCNYFTFFFPLSLFHFSHTPTFVLLSTSGWYIVKLNWRCWMWIQAQNGKDVGQNLQSKSLSKNRCYWVTQLLKEGPLSESLLWSLFAWALRLTVRRVIIHLEWLFSCQGWEGECRHPCLIL